MIVKKLIIIRIINEVNQMTTFKEFLENNKKNETLVEDPKTDENKE